MSMIDSIGFDQMAQN